MGMWSKINRQGVPVFALSHQHNYFNQFKQEV